LGTNHGAAFQRAGLPALYGDDIPVASCGTEARLGRASGPLSDVVRDEGCGAQDKQANREFRPRHFTDSPGAPLGLVAERRAYEDPAQ
jgi:hypothetical protein